MKQKSRRSERRTQFLGSPEWKIIKNIFERFTNVKNIKLSEQLLENAHIQDFLSFLPKNCTEESLEILVDLVLNTKESFRRDYEEFSLQKINKIESRHLMNCRMIRNLTSKLIKYLEKSDDSTKTMLSNSQSIINYVKTGNLEQSYKDPNINISENINLLRELEQNCSNILDNKEALKARFYFRQDTTLNYLIYELTKWFCRRSNLYPEPKWIANFVSIIFEKNYTAASIRNKKSYKLCLEDNKLVLNDKLRPEKNARLGILS